MSTEPRAAETYPTDSSHWRRWRLFAVFVVALVVRLGYGAWKIPFDQQKHASDDFYASSDGYVYLAQTIVSHGKNAFSPDEPPTTFRSPTYPLMLAAVLKLTGNVGVAVLVVNSVLAAAACTAVAAFAWRYLGPRAWLAPWAPVFLPMSVWYTARSFSDVALSAFYVLFVVAAAYLLDKGTIRLGLLTGWAHGIAVTLKATVLPFVVLVPILAALFKRRALPGAVVMCVISTGLFSLLMARNYTISGKATMSGGFGYNLLLGYYGGRMSGDADQVQKTAFQEIAKEYQATTGKTLTHRDVRPVHFYDIPPQLDSELRDLALKKIASDPLIYLRNIPVHAFRFWCASGERRNQIASAVMHFPIAILGLIGIIRLGREQPLIAFWWAAASFGYFLVYSLTWVHTVRFALPVLLLLAPLAVWQVELLLHRMLGRPQSATVSRSSVLE